MFCRITSFLHWDDLLWDTSTLAAGFFRLVPAATYGLCYERIGHVFGQAQRLGLAYARMTVAPADYTRGKVSAWPASLVNGDDNDGIQAIPSAQSCTIGLLRSVDSSCHCVVRRLSYMMGISVCGGYFSYARRFCVFGAVAGNIFSHHLDLPLDKNMYGLEILDKLPGLSSTKRVIIS